MAKTVICQNCHGGGKQGIPPDEVECEQCFGSGVINRDGYLGIFASLSPTCKVAGCMNSTEYLALSDAAKDGVKIVLSCGLVDMRDGQWARTTLWAIFGEASLTRAALIAMFG